MVGKERELRPELKTWRFLNAAHGVMLQTLEAAKEEDLDSLVGHQVREAGLYVAAALATLESRRPEEDERFPPIITTLLPVSVFELAQLIALVTGARDRFAAADQLSSQLDVLRDRLIEADLNLRRRQGLPVD